MFPGLTSFLLKVFGTRNERVLKRLWPLVAEVNAREEAMAALTDEGLRKKTDEFRDRFAHGETLDDLLPDAFAAAREAARRHLRTQSGVPMRHFDVQILGGIVLHQGRIAEMVTGEGKTLVATLAAYLNAIEGKGVHIVTVNDYLARRDRGWMGVVFEALGMTVGVIQAHMENADRKVQYGCDITYGTNNEFGFDYLRDNMKIDLRDQVQRKLHYAIVDEVDSILIDEARTPLIISGPSEDSTDKYYIANRVAQRLVRDRDYEVKEKEHQIILSEEGIERAERLVGVESFYTGRNMEWPHHIEQSLRAKELFKRDVHYVVREGDVIIVDEFTGRLMEGRTWSEGLHQAVEAKESLHIKEENQTLATITLQNYFKLYDKISGMTGTAMTEGVEFDRIYKLDVVAIPTNKPMRRINFSDVVYRTTREKYKAICDEIEELYRIGRPLLVGTVSIEKSELLSGMLSRRGIPHEVLNAKHHEREAEIVAKAGRLATVTIATNMAGRGTDIILGTFTEEELLEHWKKHDLAPKGADLSWPPERLRGALVETWANEYLDEKTRAAAAGDPEQLAKSLGKVLKEVGVPDLALSTKVADLGGLHILGTERHEARRIDNQLRGRSGRQGDPGSSRFYLSLEDDLMRVFASERVSAILKRLGMTEGQEISHPMVNRAIERAQKKVEARNFEIRKNLLEYDEVMNEQRKLVYSQRQEALEGLDLRKMILGMFDEIVEERVSFAMDPRKGGEEPDPAALLERFNASYGLGLSPDAIAGREMQEVMEVIRGAYRRLYEEKTAEMGEEMMGRVERFILLMRLDEKWKDHLHAMDQLRAGISMRAYAQTDPKVAYKREGYDMFQELITSLREDVTELVLKVRVRQEDESRLGSQWSGSNAVKADAPELGSTERQKRAALAGGQGGERPRPIERQGVKIGRNDPCPCGSGKKYKRCCGTGAS
ncbi:MAG: preprotein translocase subunit SecA [Planctomycetes bacterium]|nr:preprotein translocase subunit SecA [Planctomycetota bacterium]